jgi:AraC-like DNA-binding protein
MTQPSFAIEQLIPGRLRAEESTAALGPSLISRIDCNLPVLIRSTGMPGWASYVLPGPTCSIYCSGIRCTPEHCLVADDSTDLELICRSPSKVEVFVCRLRARNCDSIRHSCGTCSLAGNAAELARMRAAITSLRSPPGGHATMSHVSLVHVAALDELRDRLAELPAITDASASLAANRRASCIEQARRYIHANLEGALRISNICEAAGIRSRSLEYGFRELLGVSPLSYVKALRLNLVYRLLLSSASASRTITAIAMDSGFCHLSQFAADYQKFFGESPSITRKRSLTQGPANARETLSVSGF